MKNLREKQDQSDKSAADLDAVLARSERAKALKANARLLSRSEAALHSLLDAVASSSLEDMMDEDGVLIGSGSRAHEPTAK